MGYLGKDDSLFKISQKYFEVKVYPWKHSKALSKSVNNNKERKLYKFFRRRYYLPGNFVAAFYELIFVFFK